MTKATNNCVQTLDTIKARITIHRGLGLSWRQIAALAEFGGSSAGMLSNILNGYEPRTAETRKRLGLPPVAVPVMPCPDCGEAHVVGWCVKVDGEPVKPKPTYNKKATQPSPDDIVSFTVKMTRAQREQINETAKGRGVTTKEMICSEYLEET